VNQLKLLGLPTSLLPRLFFGVCMDLDQVIAVGAEDQPLEALLSRKGGVTDPPTSSVEDEKKLVGFGDVVHGRTSSAPRPDLRQTARLGVLSVVR
jgi:hypothetical protein